MPHRAIYALPPRPRPTPTFGIEPKFAWDPDLPGPSAGGIQFIPSIGLMMTPDYQGSIHFRDPVSAKPVVSYTGPISLSDGMVAPCYVPSCNKVHIPIYGGSSANYMYLLSLETGDNVFVGSLASGLYQGIYCPTNDRIYQTGFNSNLVYAIDPWIEADVSHAGITSISTGIGGVTLGIAFCPLNGKVYCLSRSATNVQRIDPATNAVDNTVSSGGGYDTIFYSDGLKKMVIMAAASALNWKTIDPLNSDAVASLGFGGIAFGGTYCPTTGETLVVDNGGAALRFIDQAGSNVATITATGEGLKYAGWNPVTKTVWITDQNNRKLWVVDPLERVTLERLGFAKSAG